MAKYSVRKANYLINLEEKMSKAAQLWVSYLIACLPRAVGDADEFPSLTFTFREVKRAINADGKRRVTDSKELKSIHKELIRTPLWYEDEKKGRWVAWLTEVEWDKEIDNFTYYFHPKLKPYLLNVKDHFTIYNYYYRVCLSPHGMKLYEILKSYQYQGEIVLDIEEDIKPSLGLANKYKKYYDFRRRVLDPVQEEILQFTDICFDYEEAEKEGKRVLALRFIIKQNTPTNLPKPLLEALQKTGTRIQNSSQKAEHNKVKYAEIFAVLEPWGGNEETITGLVHEYGLEKIKYYINYTKRQQKAGKIKGSAFGYFRRGLEEGWKDKLQDNQQAKAERRERSRQAGNKLAMLKEERATLLNAYYKEIRRVCDALIAEDAGLLERCMQSIQRNERKRASLKRLIDADPQRQIYTLQQWYKDHLGQTLLSKEIQKLFPAPFSNITMSYRQKVEQIDAQLRNLGEYPNTIELGIESKKQPPSSPPKFKAPPRTGQVSNLGELVQTAIPNKKTKHSEFSEALFDQWKTAFPDAYESMYQSYISQYQQLLGKDFELNKYKQSIQLKILFDVKDMYESGEWHPG